MKLNPFYFVIFSLAVTCSLGYGQEQEHVDAIKNNITEGLWAPKKMKTFKVPGAILKRNKSSCSQVIFTINSEGKVVNSSVVKSFPDDMMDKAALNAITKFKYNPTALNVDRLPAKTTFIFTVILNSETYETVASKCM